MLNTLERKHRILGVSLGFLCVVIFKEGTEDKILHVFVLRGKPFFLFYDWRHLL
jgi:hypothetical protein